MMIAIALVAIVSSLVACTASGGTSALTGKTWQLTAVTEKTPAFQGVIPAADQPRYTVEFNTDGTYSGQADCNAISGKYTTSGTNVIAIEAGASTLMMCADPESFGSIYAHALTTATTWAVANNELTLGNAAGATLQFAAGTAAASPSAAVASAAPAASQSAADLVGVTWQLSGITETVPAFEGAVPAAEQPAANYTIAFAEDRASAPRPIATRPRARTRSEPQCADDHARRVDHGDVPGRFALGDLYVLGLGNAASYVVADTGLTITLKDGGALQFVKGA